MKKMKRLLAVLLTMVMVMGLGVGVFAATAATITVSGMPTGADNTTVKYVQVVEPKRTNVTGWDVVDAYEDIFMKAFDVNTEEEVIEKLVALGKLEDINNAFASKGDINNANTTLSSQFAAALNQIKPEMDASDSGNGNWTIDADKAGLYVIKATADGYSYIPMAAYIGYNNNESELVSATVVAKGTETKINKDVVGTDDDSVSEGDEVEFTVNTEYPYYEKNASEKTFEIIDTLTNGTFVQSSVTIKVGDVILEAGSDKDYTINFNDENNRLVISFNYNDEYASGTVVLTYKAVVGAGAGDVVNEIKSTFDTAGDSVTLDKVEVKVVKVDVNDNEKVLDGAKFAIYEAVTQATEGYEEKKDVTVNGMDETQTLYLKDVTEQSLPEGVTEAVTGTDGTLTFVGLDAQKTYYIRETEAPEGYRLNDDYYLLSNNGENGVTTDKVHTFNNFNQTTVKDTKLSALPSTGGIGTTIFTVVGCLIMVAAAGMFFANKRRA